MEDLTSKVIVEFIGEASPFNAIILTHKSFHHMEPTPEIFEAEKERGVCEWLESRGNVSSSLHPICTTFNITLSTGVHPEEYQWEVIVKRLCHCCL